MARAPFDPTYEDLPETLPLFPLPGALLLPGGQLPLNIFEPRYLAMVEDSLAGARLIGMIQPTESDLEPGSAPLYGTGCAGRLTAFAETSDRRYLITLSGLIRFDSLEELPARAPYRQVRVDYRRYRGDLIAPALTGDELDRRRLLDAFHSYLQAHDLESDWSAIEKAEDEELVTALAMACPFSVAEQQALLEAPSFGARVETLTALLELRRLGEPDSQARH